MEKYMLIYKILEKSPHLNYQESQATQLSTGPEGIAMPLCETFPLRSRTLSVRWSRRLQLRVYSRRKASFWTGVSKVRGISTSQIMEVWTALFLPLDLLPPGEKKGDPSLLNMASLEETSRQDLLERSPRAPKFPGSFPALGLTKDCDVFEDDFFFIILF